MHSIVVHLVGQFITRNNKVYVQIKTIVTACSTQQIIPSNYIIVDILYQRISAHF